jgi:DNA-binding MarR family transcriptional regulator
MYADESESTPPPRGIGEELNRLLRSKGHEALLSLLRTADVAKHRFTELFDREGVTFQQYNVLRILTDAGSQGLPTLEIGDRMVERTPGVTRIVDRLVAKGWVGRERFSDDRRKVWCRVTPEGRALLDRLDQPVFDADREIFSSLEPADLDHLIRSLDILRAGMR